MNFKNIKTLFLLGVFLLPCSLIGQTTNVDTNKIVIDMIPNTRNPGETPTFYISRHAITPEQYCVFLNAVDTTEGRFYHSEWDCKPTTTNFDLATIHQSSTFPFCYTPVNYETCYITTKRDPLTLRDQSVTNRVPERPIMKGVPMADAARFCNWLAHSQPSGLIEDETTETGSYSFFERRNKQADDDFKTKTIYNNYLDPNDDTLKLAYMNVTRTGGATWRLPTRAELSTIFDNWRSLDKDSKLVYWTEDSYLMDRPSTTWYHYDCDFPENDKGYYFVKNGGGSFGRIDLSSDYQTSFVPTAGFFVVFSANAMPQNGFRILLPQEVIIKDPTTNSTSSDFLPPHYTPPAIPEPTVLAPPKNNL